MSIFDKHLLPVGTTFNLGGSHNEITAVNAETYTVLVTRVGKEPKEITPAHDRVERWLGDSLAHGVITRRGESETSPSRLRYLPKNADGEGRNE